MDNYLIAYSVLAFVAVIAAVEAIYYWWISTRGEEAQRIKRRLSSIYEQDAKSEGNGSLLKHRYLNSSSMIDKFILILPFSRKLDDFLAQSGLNWTAIQFFQKTIFYALAGLIFSFFINLNFLFSLILILIFTLVPLVIVFRARDQRFSKIEEQLPEAIDAISRSLRAGHALTNALTMVAEEMPDPIATEFRMTLEENNLGISMNDSLLNMSMRIPLTDVRYFIIAMLIQRETGGNLAEILNKISYTIRERFKLLAQIKVFTSEGRASAWVLGLLPFVIGGLLSLVNPQFLAPLFNDPIGLQMITVGMVFLVIGVLWMRKIIRIHI